MKNVLLFIVLGLFTTGCFEEGWDNPIGSIDTGCEINCDKWQYPTTGYIYSDEDFCEDICPEACIDYEG